MIYGLKAYSARGCTPSCWRLKRSGKHPALLRFHGYSGDSGAAGPATWHYAQSGFVVAALDCRGQGGKSEDKGGVQGNTLHGQIIRGLDDPDPAKMLTAALFLDTAQLARIVMDFHGGG
jgi:cephalosporin-C deacetylase